MPALRESTILALAGLSILLGAGCVADPLVMTRPGESDGGGVGDAGDGTDAGDRDDGTAEAGAPVGIGGGSGNGGDPCHFGQDVFEENAVHRIELELSEADWRSLIQEAGDLPEYGGPSPTYFESVFRFDGVALAEPVAVRVKGHGARLGVAESGSESFALKLDFDRIGPKQTFDGLKKLNLHPNTEGWDAVAEHLSYGAIRDYGVPTARLGWARVAVNGQELGLYASVEQMNGAFVACHFDEPRGDLYKPEEPQGNLSYISGDFADYDRIEHKWPETSDHASLLHLLEVLAQGDVERFGEVLDIEGALTYLAVNAGVGAPDYYASYGHNYYLYESTPGVFSMLPWDYNWSQGEAWFACGYGRNSEDWPVSNGLLGDAMHVARYKEILADFLGTAGSTGSIRTRLSRIERTLGEDLAPWVREQLYANAETRVESLRSDLERAGDICPKFTD